LKHPFHFIMPEWPAPPNIVALTTTRAGGVSEGAYAGFNLGLHVGDQAEHVKQNRLILQRTCQLPGEPVWLNQVHGNTILNVDSLGISQSSENLAVPEAPTADGSYTRQAQQICAVLTADCLPVLLCNREGTEIAAVHVGWRGCLVGILANAVACFRSPPSDLLAWLGPAIGPEAFEVGPEVFEAFVAQNADNSAAFHQRSAPQYQANLYQLATLALAKAGVKAVYGGDYCTFSDNKRFFSYRKEGGITGRIASLILISSIDRRD
jgi:YfiH family protein